MPGKASDFVALFTTWAPGKEPQWLRQSNDKLRDPVFVNMQARLGFPTRTAAVDRRSHNLPHPIELFRVAEPGQCSFVLPVHRWEIARRMGGWVHHEISYIERSNLSRWINDPAHERISDPLFCLLCKQVSIDPVWASAGDQSRRPDWLDPWVDWDKKSRLRGLRKTLQQSARSKEVISGILVEASTQTYRHWQMQVLKMLDACPSVGFADISEQERTSLRGIFNATKRWRSFQPTKTDLQPSEIEE